MTDLESPSFEEQLRSRVEFLETLDVKILAEGRTMKASKDMLCAQSPVIQAMFAHDFEETRTMTIKMEFEASTVRKFLDYIHNDKLHLKETPKLYELANFYMIDDLKERCYTTMLYLLFHTDPLSCFVVARKFNLSELKELAFNEIKEQIDITTCKGVHWFAKYENFPELEVIRFLNANFCEVVNTSKWKKLPAHIRAQIFERQLCNLQTSQFHLATMNEPMLIFQKASESTYYTHRLLNVTQQTLAVKVIPCSWRNSKFKVSGTTGIVKSNESHKMQISKYKPGDTIIVLVEVVEETDTFHISENGTLCRQFTFDL